MGTWQFTPVAGLYLVSSIVSFALAVLSWRLRPARGSLAFSVMTASAGVWAAGYLFGFFSAAPDWKLIMLRVEYLGAVCLSVAWPVFVLSYVHPDRRLSRGATIGLLLVPALTYLQVLTYPSHQLFYRSYEFELQDGLLIALKDYGPGFYVWAAFAWLSIIGGSVVFIRGVFDLPVRYRSQAVPVLAVLVAMLVPNMLYVFGVNPLAPYDPTPLSFGVIGIAFMVALHRSRLFDIVPVAHALVFRQMRTGAIVLDERDRVLAVNRAAERALELETGAVLGRPVGEVVPEHEDLIGMIDRSGELGRTVELLRGERFFEATVAPLSKAARRGPEGRVVMLYDVTTRKRALERQATLAAQARASVRTLRGLLPICAACKRIRDDDGYWQEVESYVKEHSEARFSHAMCPECAREYYGDLAEPVPKNDDSA
jgi:hypothetical protein